MDPRRQRSPTGMALARAATAGAPDAGSGDAEYDPFAPHAGGGFVAALPPPLPPPPAARFMPRGEPLPHRARLNVRHGQGGYVGASPPAEARYARDEFEQSARAGAVREQERAREHIRRSLPQAPPPPQAPLPPHAAAAAVLPRVVDAPPSAVAAAAKRKTYESPFAPSQLKRGWRELAVAYPRLHVPTDCVAASADWTVVLPRPHTALLQLSASGTAGGGLTCADDVADVPLLIPLPEWQAARGAAAPTSLLAAAAQNAAVAVSAGAVATGGISINVACLATRLVVDELSSASAPPAAASAAAAVAAAAAALPAASPPASAPDASALPVKHSVRVVLFDRTQSSHTLLRQLRCLVMSRGESLRLPGGSWSADKDGGRPGEDDAVLVACARRHVLDQTGIDLAPCLAWLKFMQVSYHRPEEVVSGRCVPEAVEQVSVFLCMDAWAAARPHVAAADGGGLVSAGPLPPHPYRTLLLAEQAARGRPLPAAISPTRSPARSPTAAAPATAAATQAEREQAAFFAAMPPQMSRVPPHDDLVESRLDAMRADDVRAELKARGLPAVGRRLDLVEILRAAAFPPAVEEKEAAAAASAELPPTLTLPLPLPLPPLLATAIAADLKPDSPCLVVRVQPPNGAAAAHKNPAAGTDAASGAKAAPVSAAGVRSARNGRIPQPFFPETYRGCLHCGRGNHVVEQCKFRDMPWCEWCAEFSNHGTHSCLKAAPPPPAPPPPPPTPQSPQSPPPALDVSRHRLIPLSSLLEYSKQDIKERHFEVSLFAEMFRELLARDCAGILALALIGAGGSSAAPPAQPAAPPPPPQPQPLVDGAGKRKLADVQGAGRGGPAASATSSGSPVAKRPRLDEAAATAPAGAALPLRAAADSADRSSWPWHVSAAWRMFDTSGSGYLEVAELLSIFAASDLNFSLGALQTILRRVAKPPDASPTEPRSRVQAPLGGKWRVTLADILPSSQSHSRVGVC